MARKVFYSFHYQPDHWRASTVRSIGAIEGNQVLSDNDWETVTKGGDKAIEKWIGDQMYGKSCAIILIGNGTANRKWINYEIGKAWDDKKGVVGIHIHNLKHKDGTQSYQGSNPFDSITKGGKTLSSLVKAYNPPYSDSKDVYAHIEKNIESWAEEAVKIRNSN